MKVTGLSVEGRLDADEDMRLGGFKGQERQGLGQKVFAYPTPSQHCDSLPL